MPRWALPSWSVPRPLHGLLLRVPWYARRQKRFSKAEVMGAIPYHNPRIDWEAEERNESQEGERAETNKSKAVCIVTLKVPRRTDWVGKIVARLVAGPDHKRVELDEIGSEVWTLCDGERNVEGLVREMARRHKLSRLEAETSLTAFLRTLARRGFVGLRQGEPVQPPGRSRRRRRQRQRGARKQG